MERDVDRKLRRMSLIAAVAATPLMGCVDVDLGGPDVAERTTVEQGVTVVPEFSISGTDAIPESLYITDLGLTVSEIRLEPLTTSSLAYSTREATSLHFDLAGEETLLTADPVELPHAGRYLVSIRLEPVDGSADVTSSLSAQGFVIESGDAAVDDVSDGEPQPMPFDPKADATDDEVGDASAYPTEWTPFQYHSKRAVFYTFSDVEFEAGEQVLSFSFNLHDWAGGVAEPISNAVRANRTDDSVDVTNQVDSSGTGAEALMETGVVRTVRRTPER